LFSGPLGTAFLIMPTVSQVVSPHAVGLFLLVAYAVVLLPRVN